jgi:hypothetical protein
MPGRRRGRGPILAIEGISGSGKSTVARELAAALGAELIPEAIERMRPRPSLAFGSTRELLRLERRLLEEDAARYREADQIAGGGGAVVVDTGFFGPLTYTRALASLGLAPGSAVHALIRVADARRERFRWGPPDRIFWLATRPDTRRRRVLADPKGHPAALAERHERAGREEERTYRELLQPALGARLTWVEADAPADRIVGRIRAALAAGPQGFAPEGLADGVLRALEVDVG